MNVIEDVIIPAMESMECPLLEDRRDTPVLGAIDSMRLVSLVVCIEEVLQEKVGKTVTLMSAHAFSRSTSPFKTVGTLADYIETLI